MPWENKSNTSNKSNKSNTSNASGELAHMGNDSSSMLSEALDMAARALDMDVAPAITDDYLGRFAGLAADFRLGRLNARHRLEIVVSQLMQSVSLDLGTGEKATLKSDGKEVLILSLRGMDAERWNRELADLRVMKWHREERMCEIVAQQDDIMSFLALAIPVGPQTNPWIGTLCDAVLEITFRLCAAIKYHLPVARPIEMAPDIAPVIQTPSHSSFPAGHAAEAFALAMVLGAFYPDRWPALRRMAARIAENRAYAGVHFRIDCLAGAILGDAIGRIVLAKAGVGETLDREAEIFVASVAADEKESVAAYGARDGRFGPPQQAAMQGANELIRPDLPAERWLVGRALAEIWR